MRARYYDAELGRFLKEDPIGFDGGLNVSLYVGGNPIIGIDPSGLMCTSEDERACDIDVINLGFGVAGLVAGSSAVFAGSTAALGGTLMSGTGAGAVVGVPIALGGAAMAVAGAHGVMSSLTQIENSFTGQNQPGPLESVAGQLAGAEAAEIGQNADFALGLAGFSQSGANLANGGRSILDMAAIADPIFNMTTQQCGF